MRIYAIGYFEGDTYKVKRVKANTVAEAHEKANLDTPIVRIQREEYKDINMAIEALKAEPQSISFENDTDNFQPSISIVRCKDCKHLYNDADTGKACEFTNMGMEPNDFCSYGERSEE